MENKAGKQEYYRKWAAYYANIPIQKKEIKAVVHLEDKEDELFWQTVFIHYLPFWKFQFIPGSRNHKGNRTTGSAQCLAYKAYLNNRFLVCIDTDYRYLLQEPQIDIHHFIFQTYTYSFENHLCLKEGLPEICRESCGYNGDYRAMEETIERYSFLIYDLFVWHIGLYKQSPQLFSIKEFENIIVLDKWNKLEERISDKMAELSSLFPNFDFIKEKDYLETLGVNRNNVYLYIRGHNLFSLIIREGKSICTCRLKEEAENTTSLQREKIFNEAKNFEEVIWKNIHYTYPEMQKIGTDMKTYKAQNP